MTHRPLSPVRILLLLSIVALGALLGTLLWSFSTSSQTTSVSQLLSAPLLGLGLICMLAAALVGGAQAPVDYTSPTIITVSPLYKAVESAAWRREALRVQDNQMDLGLLGLILFVLGAALFASPVVGAVALGVGLAGTVLLFFELHRRAAPSPR